MKIDPIVLRLISARIARGLTQSEVARRAGVSRTCLSETERGKRSPNLVTVRAIANVVGVELEGRFRRCPSRIAHESGVVLRCMDSAGHAREHFTVSEQWTDDDDRARND